MNILIGGDSWSQGEWGYNSAEEYGVLHKGLEQYLVDDGHHVVNVGRGGMSNKGSLRAVEDELLEVKDYDILIWFETSPARGVKMYKEVDTLEDMRTRFNNSTRNSYTKLAGFNVPRKYIVGGLQKSNQQILDSIEGDAIIIVESLIEWLTGLEQDEVYAGSKDIKNLADMGFSFEVLNYMMENTFRFKALERDEYAEYFRPDGGHINRKGHLKLFNRLKDGGFLD